MFDKELKASCVYCGRIVFSFYQKQLDYNIAAHELSCVRRSIDKKLKEDLSSSKKKSKASNKK